MASAPECPAVSRITLTTTDRPRPPRLRVLFAGTALCLSCALPPPIGTGGPDACEDAEPERIEVAVYRRAKSEQQDRLEREIERLRLDLKEAEEVLVAAESGLRGRQSRPDAVSELAAVRIEVDRAARRATWRGAEIEDARRMLVEADQQLRSEHFGAALFFVYRARRIAADLEGEAELVRENEAAFQIDRPQVNLREGPSTGSSVREVLRKGTPVFVERRRGKWMLVRSVTGPVGWVWGPLLRPYSSELSPATTTQSRPASLAR